MRNSSIPRGRHWLKSSNRRGNAVRTADQLVSSLATDVVALGITEHLPWNAITLKNMLSQIAVRK